MTTANNQTMTQWTTETLREQLSQWQAQYGALNGGNLKLDLSRGKPGIEQVSLSNGLDGILQDNFIAQDGTDTRNDGAPEALPRPEHRALKSWACQRTTLWPPATPA